MNRGNLAVFGIAVFFAILFGSLTFETVMAKPNSNSSADSGVCHFDNTDTQMWEALWVNSKGQMKAHVNVHGDAVFTTEAEAAWCVTNQDGTIVEPIAVCGDGVITAPEFCDDGANNGMQGFCDFDCLDLTHSICGDGIVAGFETCDDGANNGTPGFCNTSCNGQVPADCGDGVITAPETCDDGPANGSPGNCNATCDGQVPSLCGNNEIDVGEECDGTDLGLATCESQEPDFNLEVNLLGNLQGNVKGSIDGVFPENDLFCNDDCTLNFSECSDQLP